jgi:hypothetical protein|tara:strand:+ start:7445 stop:8359 length:915 start_codon:yes stop_codon:yes gene_type:complete
MSESIEGGTYGEVVDREVADSLFTPDEGEQQQTAPTSETDSEVTTDEQVETQETEQPESSEETVPTEDSESEDYQFTEVDIDGNTYTTEQLQEALQDSSNKAEWQKSNTQKAQDIADQEKALKAEFDRIKGVMQDEEVVESMKDVLGEDHEFFKESTVQFSENVEQSQEQVKPVDEEQDNARFEHLESQVREMQLKEQVATEINQLVQAHPELEADGDAISEVLDIAVDRNIADLEDAFTLAQSRATDESAMMKAMKKLKDAEELKAIPEVDSNKKGDHSPKVTKSPDFDHARDVAMADYQLFE